MGISKTNFNDLALNSFSKIKSIKGNAVDLSQINKYNNAIPDHKEWHRLLRTHVDKNGKANYRGFYSDGDKLDRYLASLTLRYPGANWSNNERLAYWINAYNAFTIQLINKHYPIKSIKDIKDGLPMIDSPWDIKFFKIGKVTFDLNTIEHEILRKQFNDSRIHFAINCASKSCPKLRNEAFVADHIDRQLEEQSIDFLSDTTKNIITVNETKLSKIFDWFESDFNQQGSVKTFIKSKIPNFNTSNRIRYLNYDWSLNE